jgi:Recombination endonuclease VII
MLLFGLPLRCFAGVFIKNPQYLYKNGGFFMKTKEQKLEYQKQYRLNNQKKIIKYRQSYKERAKENERKRTLKIRGIREEDFNEMFKQQNGKCAICGTHQNDLNKFLCIDHSHKTNKIRGLLCNNCNRGIGHLKDDINILLKAIDYLKQYS